MAGSDFLRRCSADPFISELVSWQRNHGLGAATWSHPWMAIAEQRLYCYACQYNELVFCNQDKESELVSTDLQKRLAANLAYAKPFLWFREQIAAASSLPLPDHTIAEPGPPFLDTFHVWSDDGKEEWYRRAALISVQQGHILVFNFTMHSRDHRLGLFTSVIKCGNLWPSEDDDPAPHGQVLRLFAFLNSRAAADSEQRPPRAILRRADRVQGSTAPPTPQDCVHVIKLRGLDRDAEDRIAESDGGHSYKNRFWVRGHIRAQWYPSEKGHRLIYIDPFVKGPANAPFAEQVYVVCR